MHPLASSNSIQHQGDTMSKLRGTKCSLQVGSTIRRCRQFITTRCEMRYLQSCTGHLSVSHFVSPIYKSRKHTRFGRCVSLFPFAGQGLPQARVLIDWRSSEALILAASSHDANHLLEIPPGSVPSSLDPPVTLRSPNHLILTAMGGYPVIQDTQSLLPRNGQLPISRQAVIDPRKPVSSF
jgi:hypothetical protein